MNRPGFFHDVTVALVLSLVGSIVFAALAPATSGQFALRIVIAGVSLAYVIELLRTSGEPTGRLLTLALWVVTAAWAWWGHWSLSAYAITHVGAIWLIRSLYWHPNLLSAGADLGLSALSLAAAVWASSMSASMFLTLWSFFLVQAFVLMLPLGGRRPDESPQTDRFQRAHRLAEAALRRLSI
jgi:hypothetical protein